MNCLCESFDFDERSLSFGRCASLEETFLLIALTSKDRPKLFSLPFLFTLLGELISGR